MNCQDNGSASSTKSTKRKQVTKRPAFYVTVATQTVATQAHSIRSSVFRSLCIFLSVTAVGANADAVIAKQAPGDMYQNFRQAQIHSADCDKALAEKMRLVAAAFRRYRLRNGHYPEEGQQSFDLEKNLSRVAGRNAYGGFEKYLVGPDSSVQVTTEQPLPSTSEQPSASSSSSSSSSSMSRPSALAVGTPTVSIEQTNALTPIKIKVDLALSSILLSSLQQATPQTWHAEPGTITVIHNTEDFYLVWGAGINGKPVHTDSSDKPLMISPEAH